MSEQIHNIYICGHYCFVTSLAKTGAVKGAEFWFRTVPR